jgi:hypothetical protein
VIDQETIGMHLEDLEHLLNNHYYSDERQEEHDPGGTYLLAFAVVELVKELRALRKLNLQEESESSESSE